MGIVERCAEAAGAVLADNGTTEDVVMAVLLESGRDTVYEPLKLIAEAQGWGGKCEAAVMVGILDGEPDGLCFVQCVPDHLKERVAALLRSHADALTTKQDDAS